MNLTERVDKTVPIKGIGRMHAATKRLKTETLLTGCFGVVNVYSPAGWPVCEFFLPAIYKLFWLVILPPQKGKDFARRCSWTSSGPWGWPQ